jgi:CheY-like chemotaxis protein
MIDALKPMLERLGYSVIARTSSIEALEGFQSDPSEFDLVVTDQTMPGLTGAELAKEFLRIKPGIPIILCSGFSELINEEGAKAMGIRGYVGKPIVREEMAATIRSALDNG